MSFSSQQFVVEASSSVTQKCPPGPIFSISPDNFNHSGPRLIKPVHPSPHILLWPATTTLT